MAIGIDRKLFKKLERFELGARGMFRGGQIGNRRSTSRGSGLEFADHKEYSVGDDIRYLDWNVYGRLEELFIKLFEQEEILPVYLLLDRSASMSLGHPAKGDFSAQVAGALAYVALANQDHVRVFLIGEGLLQTSKLFSTKAGIYDVLNFLDSAPKGGTDLAAALRAFSGEVRLPGVAFILSDFLDPKGILDGVRLLTSRNFAVCGLHVLSEAELNPELSGDIELHDVEGERTLRIPLRRDTAGRFKAFVQAHCDEIRSELRRYGVTYVRVFSEQPLEPLLFGLFPKLQVFK